MNANPTTPIIENENENENKPLCLTCQNCPCTKQPKVISAIDQQFLNDFKDGKYDTKDYGKHMVVSYDVCGEKNYPYEDYVIDLKIEIYRERVRICRIINDKCYYYNDPNGKCKVTHLFYYTHLKSCGCFEKNSFNIDFNSIIIPRQDSICIKRYFCKHHRVKEITDSKNNSDSDPDSDTYSDSDSYSGSNSRSNSDSDPDSNLKSDSDSDSGSDSDSNTNKGLN